MKDLKKIRIIGAGPVGSLLALALKNNFNNIYVFDLNEKSNILSRDRAYAITHSTKKLLTKTGMWFELSKYVNEFNQLTIIDSITRSKIDLNEHDLPIKNRKEGNIGWIIEHIDLMNYLYNKIDSTTNIEMFFNKESTIVDNNIFDYTFCADGKNSDSRKTLGIKYFQRTCNQSCITFKAILRNCPNKKAYEIFRRDGPMAILPMGNDLYQVIISASKIKCEYLMNLPYSAFLDKIATFLPHKIEIDGLYSNAQTFPLYLSLTAGLFKGNCFLVGESAHSFHPVGGQGLNVSIRDIDDLVWLVNAKRNSYHRLNNKLKYTMKRYKDILSIAIITQTLINIFSNSNSILIMIRLVSFNLISKTRVIRKFILGIMTNGL